ncbi:hypothetical protein [Micromonospora sp. URMC 103]|uniref:hypothetical protein n=1 Tax=Micromonospora sp. URMC 103 TaxID=3423406 RepID=UPI003F1BCD24
MTSVDGGRPWQRSDRSDPVLPGPAHGAAALALLCALVAPVSWLALLSNAAAVGDPDAPVIADLVWLAVAAALALSATGTLVVVLARRPPLRRPVGALAVTLAAAATLVALVLG